MPQPKTTSPLRTVGDIAKLLGVTPGRVDYAITTYRIQPVQRAGILRLYDEAGVGRIRSALHRISEGEVL